MTTTAKRLREGRENAGMTQQELADVIGVNRRTVIRHESEGIPKRYVATYAEAINVESDWLLGNVGESPTSIENGGGDYRAVQIARINANRNGLVIEKQGVAYLAKNEVLTQILGYEPEDVFLWRVTGTTMEGEINPGDGLMMRQCEPTEMMQHKGVYLMFGPHAFGLHRITLTAGSVIIGETELPLDTFVDQFTLVAKAIAHIRHL